ncbi:hypothetical protein JQC91_11435 [Jannaschia sp. Os4]|uniref:hypothetical protein n=1 Tax=Jannaschia sp. Os4 TaxID=2807617 RepID=UPI001939BB1E|nr:hypothetical protein [Jannaschia sp. Os4]MBM2576911.1 hypothetical protein [Jannaschia sp. Os4]
MPALWFLFVSVLVGLVAAARLGFARDPAYAEIDRALSPAAGHQGRRRWEGPP